MQWLANVCVKRPVFAMVLIVTIVVVGIIGYKSLSLDRFPNVDFPIVTVVTVLPGAAPQQIETEVTDKLEEAVNTISGLEELQSVSTEGVSQLIVRFNLDKDVNLAAQEVRDQVATALPNLPEGTKNPVITKLDPDAAPVLFVALLSKKPIRDVTEFADHELRTALENVQGVGQVTILGGRKRQIQVVLDPVKLRAAGLSAIDVQRAIVAQNVTTPGGAVDTGPQRLTFRVSGRVPTVTAIGEIIVRAVESHPISVADIGTVIDGQEEAETAASIDGEPAVVLSIRKQSGTNSVEVVDALNERMKEFEPRLPPGYKLSVIRDNTETTRTSVGAVKEHLGLGAVLASLVVLLFLGSLRSTFIAAIAIPTSIVGTFMCMWWMGFTINTITLLALALAVGIVIDDAIVVLENIFRYIEEKRVRPMPAAILATKEIGLPVLATTLSLLAVFLPVAFMSSIPGRFLRSFGLTMGAAIVISLLVSFTLTPMLASRLLRRPPEGERRKTIMERFTDAFYGPIERVYMAMLRFSLRHRWVVVLAALATLVSIVPLIMKVPKAFLPKNDEAQFQIDVRTPEGTSLAATQIAAERIAREVRQWREVRTTVTSIGDNQQKTPNLASIFVRLVPPDSRTASQDELQNRARNEIVSKLPKDYRVSVSIVPAFGAGSFNAAIIQYILNGPSEKLAHYSDQIVAKLRAIHGAVDVDTTFVTGNPELVATVNRRKAADLGVNVMDVALASQLLIGGVKVSRFEEAGRDYDILVRADEGARSSAEALSQLTVASAKLGTVPLLDVIDLKKQEGPSKIERFARQRRVMFLANTAPGVGSGEVGTELERQVKEMKLPKEYTFSAFGQSKEIKRTGAAFGFAFALAFIFMYLILAAQFESWLHPITILLSLPLTVPFALVSLLFLKSSLDIFTMLGILVLFGVVKKNSILQIAHIIQLRAEGHSRFDAIMHGNRDRLRPILMTTFAFVAGMFPLVTSHGIGAEFNRATAGPVVIGQLLSLLLTLLATPVAYTFFDDASNGTGRFVGWIARKLFGWRPQTPEETGADEVMGPPPVSVPSNGHSRSRAEAAE